MACRAGEGSSPSSVDRCWRHDRRAARAAYAAQVRRYLDLFAGLMPAGDPDDPYLILATLVGAIALARAVDDPELSDEILERVARMLHRHVQGECVGPS
jgi:TetR/AcrR family transcriptional regulator, transcriptional repressor for nem operon